MSDVPPTESNLNPEEPKAPAPAPQFQQFQSQSKLLPISTSRLLPTTRLPELPSSAYALLPQPLDVPASSTPIQIPISVQERPRLRRRSEPLTQRVCYSSNPWDVYAKTCPTIPISVQERPRLRRRSEPLTQRVCYSSN
ncbi:hypothetical protein TVAG_515840 [Trichomonas vaginalis G3]|uniref:Uncharacterized protein n=1 Tax=Trichomonas vaginalis (strain ATCC PRA-98 / G3) TaxID=412133 RepID=A2HF82_TRIV3|nr:hypothetical protein TVAG_515840 [Trichomonas vaginalis G3]|eukprot:XP_001284865.1 hypothetical protein [Trichomonas vaginalis G3]